MLQMREFGLNVTNEENKVIASVPKRQHAVYCSKPVLNPAVQAHPGGLAAEDRDPQQSNAAAPVQLRALPQATPPQRPLRLRRLRPN